MGGLVDVGLERTILQPLPFYCPLLIFLETKRQAVKTLWGPVTKECLETLWRVSHFEGRGQITADFLYLKHIFPVL